MNRFRTSRPRGTRQKTAAPLSLSSVIMLRVKILVLAMLICFTSSVYVQANDGIEVAGDVLAGLLPAAAGGLTLGYKDGKGTLQFAESTALALGSTFALKYTIGEERPNHDDHYSFPSAHASVSFSSAEFLRKRYGWEYGIPAYGVATFVAFSRVQAKQHYVHDVIASAAIGIGSSYLFTRPYEGWHIQAEVGTKFYGLRLSRSW
ncbi:MAG: phosphatase PAP2 family protein [Syntrophales bacterium LBB04]|nr:phosphatase PAP2 family protein [Syntrophales bacterium LBB04]